MKRKWWIAAGFVAVVGLLIWANLAKGGGENAVLRAGTPGPKNGQQVKVVKMAPRDLTQQVLAPGTLEATAPREVRAPFTSTGVRLLVGLGDQVTEGQVIAELEAGDLRAQVAAQEAAVARAEAALAQSRQAASAGSLSMKLETARAQMVAAEQGLATALKQSGTAGTRLEQAQAALAAVQGRAAAGNAEVSAAREKLQAAEAQVKASPLDKGARDAYAGAQAAYQDALRRAADSALQLSGDLAAAYDNLAAAERDMAESTDSAAVRQARAQLESARLALQAAQAEAENGGASAGQQAAAEADLAAQRVTLANAREKLAQASLKAPAAGTVLSLGLTSGQPAQAGQVLVTVGGLQSLTVRAKVDEVDIGKVKPGQTLSVKNNAYATETFAGQVTRVAAQAGAPDPKAGAAGGSVYEVQGEVKNPDGKLKAGMSAEARVITDTRSQVMVVGLESLREEGDKAEVLVVKDYKVEVRPVKLGLRTQTQAEVVAGLQPGDQVIVAPFTLIKSFKGGEPVRVEVVEPPDRGDAE